MKRRGDMSVSNAMCMKCREGRWMRGWWVRMVGEKVEVGGDGREGRWLRIVGERGGG